MKRKLIATLVAIMAMSSVSSVAFASTGKQATSQTNIKLLTETKKTEEVKQSETQTDETVTDDVKAAMDIIVAENTKIKDELAKIAKAMDTIVAHDDRDRSIQSFTTAQKAVEASKKAIEESLKKIEEQTKLFTVAK